MSHEEAVAAIEAAAAQEAAGESGDQVAPPPSVAPAGEPAPQVQPEPVAPETPAEPVAAEAPVEDTFDGGAFNPDTLPPELQPGWRQLQAAFTRKTQELAEQRKQIEALGQVDPAEAAQAVELLNRIRDPQNWVQMHQELGALMQQYGLTAAEAAQVAAEAQKPAPAAPELPDLGELGDDPELAPLLQSVQALQAELASMKAGQAEAAQLAEQQRQYAEWEAEVNRQEAAIRESNPHYGQEDIDAIYELAPFHEGDLAAAQAAYEAQFTRRLGRYLQSKSGPAAPSPVPTTPTPAEPAAEQTWEEITAEAEETLRQLVASGEIDQLL